VIAMPFMFMITNCKKEKREWISVGMIEHKSDNMEALSIDYSTVLGSMMNCTCHKRLFQAV